MASLASLWSLEEQGRLGGAQSTRAGFWGRRPSPDHGPWRGGLFPAGAGGPAHRGHAPPATPSAPVRQPTARGGVEMDPASWAGGRAVVPGGEAVTPGAAAAWGIPPAVRNTIHRTTLTDPSPEVPVGLVRGECPALSSGGPRSASRGPGRCPPGSGQWSLHPPLPDPSTQWESRPTGHRQVVAQQCVCT